MLPQISKCGHDEQLRTFIVYEPTTKIYIHPPYIANDVSSL